MGSFNNQTMNRQFNDIPTVMVSSSSEEKKIRVCFAKTSAILADFETRQQHTVELSRRRKEDDFKTTTMTNLGNENANMNSCS